MNLPNALTILRIFFVPLLVAALVQEDVSMQMGRVLVTNEWLALAIFLAAAEGYTIRASDLGKTKMFFQVVAISVMLLSVRHAALRTPSILLMWAVVLFSVLSAVSYFRKFWRKVDERIKQRRRKELLALERKRQKALRRQMGLSSGKEGLGTATIWKPPEVN